MSRFFTTLKKNTKAKNILAPEKKLYWKKKFDGKIVKLMMLSIGSK